MTTTNVDIAVLEAAADSIIQSSLVRSTLVQAGAVVSSYPELSEKFEKAASLYRAGAFHEAKERFYSLASTADSGRPNIFTARLNAAACAACSKDWPVVVDLLAPLFKAGNLYGHPLWNLALAWHYLGLTSDALKALEVWVSKNHEWHRARGLLLIAALAL